MDGQQTRPLVYAGSYTACCEEGVRPLVGALHTIVYNNNTNFDFPLSDEGLHDWSFYKGTLFAYKRYSKKCFCYFLCQHSKLFTHA
jgi:hypothetical protein